MRRKKVLVHGTLDSLQKFFLDAISRDFDIVGILSDEPEKISVKPLEVLAPQNLPAFVLKLVDGIIFTGKDKSVANFFVKQGLPPQKFIFWNAAQGWTFFKGRDKDGSQMIFFCGLAFHIRNDDDTKFFNETFRRLQTQRQVKNLKPQMYPAMLVQQYQQRMKRPLDLNNPQTFTEKLQWIKIFDATPIKSRLADKYLVRRWVADKIGEQYLIPLLGVWDNFDDINFDELPDQFVLKCNHGSGMNIIVRDKKTFDKRQAREKLNAWLAYDYGAGRKLELHYTRIKRKILAEKFIQNGDLPDLTDYKFHCFDGTPKFISVIGGRDVVNHTKFNEYYNLDWQSLGDWLFGDYQPFPTPLKRPACLDEMKRCAKILCKSFNYVRVDFYEIDGKVYFGEMTFTPGAGDFPYKNAWTYEKDIELGSLLKLPAITPPPIFINTSVDYRVRQKFQQEIKFPSPPEKLPERKIIASLTSWTKRIGTAHIAIQTILNQTRRPDLTVLYLAKEEFPRREANLPRELLNLRSERFEIRWTKNIRSYKKLIPALKDFPDDIIVTFDDDLIFHPALIKRLLVGYKKYPEMIHAHRVRNLTFDATGKIIRNSGIPYTCPTYLHKLSGGAGCMYPPHSLHEEVLREDKFMTLAPTNDDIWFWLMGILNGRRVNSVDNYVDSLNVISGTREVGLFHLNHNGEKLFYKHLDNILNAYPVLRNMLLYEQHLAFGK